MKRAISALLLSSTIACASAQADTTSELFDNDAACMEGPLAQFGQYIGDWKISDSQLAQDGSGWSDGNGARWIFACLGNGTAVQDFWIPNGGEIGTNLRIYNQNTETWDIAWAVKPALQMSHITAKQDANGNIVMRYVSPEVTPDRRITFFPATKDGWKWKLELSSDEGATWTEVYRISASPYQ